MTCLLRDDRTMCCCCCCCFNTAPCTVDTVVSLNLISPFEIHYPVLVTTYRKEKTESFYIPDEETVKSGTPGSQLIGNDPFYSSQTGKKDWPATILGHLYCREEIFETRGISLHWNECNDDERRVGTTFVCQRRLESG